MRKRIMAPAQAAAAPLDDKWLNLELLAELEVSSEDSAHPIEYALLPGHTSGWRATEAGEQTIRLLFADPQPIRRIWLHFVESRTERTQEYRLRWSGDGGKTFRDIVRQQWNFSPQGASAEIEDHRVDLPAVTVLELSIKPDIGGKNAIASLEGLRLA
ncbi:MAG: hypothetical protein WA210_05690 [Burkholderiaceae bacterium]